MSDLRKKIIAEVDAQGHVPTIGQTVYVLYEDHLFVEKVYSLGEKTFLLASFRANTKIDFWEWRYKDYGIRWFLTYEDAEEELLSRYTDDYMLVGYESKWYEVVRL
jgi:hypothetical protein